MNDYHGAIGYPGCTFDMVNDEWICTTCLAVVVPTYIDFSEHSAMHLKGKRK